MAQKKQSNKELLSVLQRQKARRPLYITLIIVALVFILATAMSGCVSLFTGDLDTGNVARIPIDGSISFSSAGFRDSGVDASQVVQWINDANNDDSIEAIVLDINSPGGTPVASEEIARAVASTTKPTIALVRDVAASGAYWVASASDYIIASDVSLVGSIGVLGSYLEFGDFLKDHNITYNRQVAGKYKDMGTPLRDMTEEESIKNQLLLNKMHEVFIKSVAENRNMSYGSVKQLATGEVFLGLDAVNNGLVDALGGESDVKEYLLKKYSIDADFKEYKNKHSFVDELLGFSSSIGDHIGMSLGNVLLGSRSPSLR